MTETQAPRLLIQYLEPSPAVETADPERTARRLAHALEHLPVTDLALGWDLSPRMVEAIRPVVPPAVDVWRWVPVLVDSGVNRPVDSRVAVGPGGGAPPPFRAMADFRFLCPDHEEVVEAGLDRAITLGREIDADGVLLDRIRWHSPSRSPADELTCFCERSRVVAARDGLDLERVGRLALDAASSLAGRRGLVGTLLGSGEPGLVGEFLQWRSATVTRAVARFSGGLADAGLRSALDVFTPSLASSVGQDLGALGGLADWSKSMTYLDALGPASMPFELAGYARWLEAADEPDAAGFLGDVLGFAPPGAGAVGPQLEALLHEADALLRQIGRGRSVVGIDAVEIPGVCEIDESDLDARIRALRGARVGLSPCWELLAISAPRVERMAAAWGQDEGA